MLFHSLDFAFFLPITFILYWFVFRKKLKLQNLFIVISSYIFYGWWDWRFLSLIIFSSTVDFTIAIKLHKEKNEFKRKVLLWISIITNLGLLGFFKYYNFFLENFISAFSLFGISINTFSIKIILPIGISFYTFQTLSYTIDIYRNKIIPNKDFISFSAFVCFFPQLVAGPIERAKDLLPQFNNKRIFYYKKAVDGTRQILWGLFKKLVIADNCSKYVNDIFNNYSEMSSITLIMGVVLFSIQIYCDFSGYSDIAIGTSRIFGFNLKQNFAFPYFSRNILEFWKRWHISLTSWLTDYVFTPLAINLRHLENKGLLISVFATFLLSGLWHGANWNFIFWGGIHGLIYFLTILINGQKSPKGIVAKGKKTASLYEMLSMLSTFTLVSFSYIFFRSENLFGAFGYCKSIICNSFFGLTVVDKRGLLLLIFLIIIFMIIEWLGRMYQYAIEKIGLEWKRSTRWFFYSLIVFSIFMFMQSNESPFIYFQF